MAGQFDFDIRALNISPNQLVTIAVNYSADPPGAHNGNAQTSDFALPVTLPATPQLFITLSATNVLLSWPTNAGMFNIQTTGQLIPAAWTNLNPQPVCLVTGVWYQATLPVGGSKTFFRLAR